MEPRPPARTVCLWKGHTEGPHVRAEETWRRGTAGGGTRSLQSPCSTGTVTLWETLTQTKLLPGSPVRGQRGPRRCADSFHGQVLLTHHRLFTDPPLTAADAARAPAARQALVGAPPPTLQQLTAEAWVPAAAVETASTLPAPSSRRS